MWIKNSQEPSKNSKRRMFFRISDEEACDVGIQND